MKNRFFLSALIVLIGLLQLAPQKVQANDYMEHQENYSVYASGTDRIHFSIPVWVHGSWYENDYMSLAGSWFGYKEIGTSQEVAVANWCAALGKDNIESNNKGQVAMKLGPNRGEIVITSMYNSINYTVPANNNWTDWLTIRQRGAAGYDRISFLEFDWYPPESLNEKNFVVYLYSVFWDISSVDMYIHDHNLNENRPGDYMSIPAPSDYKKTWVFDSSFRGKDNIVRPQLFDPYLYQMDEDGSTGYGYAAIPYSLYNQPISYTTSLDPQVNKCTERAGTIYVPTNDTLQTGFYVNFTVWRNEEAGTTEMVQSQEVDISPYHRIYDFLAEEERDTTGTYTGRNTLRWSIKNPTLKDIVDGDYFEIQRASDSTFSDAQSLAVLPMNRDASGLYSYSDDSRNTWSGHFEPDTTSMVLKHTADNYILRDAQGNAAYQLSLTLSSDNVIFPSMPVYYRVRRASTSIWGWQNEFTQKTIVDKHNYLAPLATVQPEYAKDSEFDTNHKINFRVILENAEVQSYVPSKETFNLSYTKTHTLRPMVTVHSDFLNTYGTSDLAFITVLSPEGLPLYDKTSLSNPVSYEVPARSKVIIDYLYSVRNVMGETVRTWRSKTFTAEDDCNLHFIVEHFSSILIEDVEQEAYDAPGKSAEDYMTSSLRQHLIDSLYPIVKATYEAEEYGRCMWDRTARLVLIRTIAETGKSTEFIIPQDSIVRLPDGNWEARFSDIADQACMHYSYAVRIDQSRSDLRLQHPETQLLPMSLSGPEIYYDECAEIVSFKASMGDAHSEMKQGVLLTWKPSSSAVDEYVLCRVLKNSNASADTIYVGQETSFLDVTAVPNIHYEYTVTVRYNCNGKATSHYASTEGWRCPYGEISGTIRMPDNSGMAGVEVELQETVNGNTQTVKTITTDATGNYLFDSLLYYYTPEPVIRLVYRANQDCNNPAPTTFVRIRNRYRMVVQDWTNMAEGEFEVEPGSIIEVRCDDETITNRNVIQSHVVTGSGMLACTIYMEVVKKNVRKPKFHILFTDVAEDAASVSHEYTIVPTSAYGLFSFNNTSMGTASITLSKDNARVSGIDFLNTNSTRMSGRVLYENTTIPVAGAMFLLNGDTIRRGGAPLLSGEDGNFELILPLGQPCTLQVFKTGHSFAGNGILQVEEGQDTFALTKPLDGVRFYDRTTVRLVGRVAGGNTQRDLPDGFGLGKNNLGDDLQLVLQLDGDNVAQFIHDPNDATRDTMQQITDHIVYTADPLEQTRIVGTTHTLFEKKRITIHPDPITGEYEVDLCPVKYKVTQATARGYATLFDAGTGSETFDLTNAPLQQMRTEHNGDTIHYNATYDRIYHTPVQIDLVQNIYGLEREAYGEPEMEVNGADPEDNRKIALYTVNSDRSVNYTLGHPVFYDNRRYQFKAKAYEAYYYNNDQVGEVDIVPQHGGTVIIRNGLHSSTSVERYPLNEKGENNAIWLYVDNVDVEHAGTDPMRSVSIALEMENNVVETNVFSAYVTGSMLQEKSLRSGNGSIQLLDIIRDPGGSGSSAYVDNGASYTFSFAQSTKGEFGVKLNPAWGQNISQYIGIYSGSPAGGSYLGSLANTQKAFTLNIPISHKIDYGMSYTCSMSTSERVSTSSASTPASVGSPADVFFGTTVSNLIGQAKSISIIDDSLYHMCKPSFDAGTMLLLAQGTDADGLNYYLVTGQKVFVGAQLNNTFVYSQYYIWNTIIPRLAQDRQNLLMNFTDSAAAQARANATGEPVYWYYETGEYINDTIPLHSYSMFVPEDGGIYIDEVGELNMLITRWLELLYLNEREKVEARTKGSKIGTYTASFGTSYSHSDSYSYSYSYNEYPQRMALQTEVVTAAQGTISSVIANLWKFKSAIWNGKPLNTSALNAFMETYWKKVNDGDEGAADATEPKKVEEVAAQAGNMKFSMSFTPIFNLTGDKRMTTSASVSKSTGFSLGADPMGEITTTVYKMAVDSAWLANAGEALAQVDQTDNESIQFGSYVFYTEAGATMCPHEDAEVTRFFNPGTALGNSTEWVAKPELAANTYEVANVAPDKRATFLISMYNQGQADAGLADKGQGFYLALDGASNPYGAKVYVNGAPLIQSLYYWIAPGTPITQTVEVERGTVDDYNLTLSLYSENCAKTTVDMHLGVHFLPLSTDVSLAMPRQNWIMNTLSPKDSTGYYLPVTIDGFDIHHKNFDHIEFQYKLSTQSDDDWVNACSFYASDSLYQLASGNKAMIENGRITPFRFYGERDPMEQHYDLRAVSFCRYGSGFVSKASPVISGTKDTRPPRVFGEPEPANSILGVGDNLMLRFNEAIAGNYLDEDNNFQITGITNEIGFSAATALHFDGHSLAYTKVERDLTDKSFTIDMMIRPAEASNRTKDMILFETGTDTYKRQIILTQDNRLREVTYAGKAMLGHSSKVLEPMLAFTRVLVVYDKTTKHRKFYIGTADVTDIIIGASSDADEIQGSGYFRFGENYEGDMLEARVWTKALTLEEISATANRSLTGYERELLAYYRMDEGKGKTIADLAHGATLYLDGCSWNKQKGFSLYLDGTQTVQLNGNLLSRSAVYDETVMLWFKAEKEGTLFSAADDILLAIENGELVLRSGHSQFTTRNASCADGAWHHMVLTVNRTYNHAALFIDGKMHLAPDANQLEGITGAMYFGGNGYKGYIDEFVIFEQALPSSLVETYEDIALTGDEMGLMAYLPFEEQFENQNGILEQRFTINDKRVFKDNDGNIINKVLPLIIENPQTDIQSKASTENAPVKSHGLLNKLYFDWSFNHDELMINILNRDNEINKQSIYVTVRDVEDMNGNPMVSPVTWTAFVDRNSLKWSEKQLFIEREYATDEEEIINIRIINHSGKRHTYTIESLPYWLTVDKTYGSIDPMGEQAIELIINRQMTVGEYSDIVYLTDENGLSEPMQIEYTIYAVPPYDAVDEGKYALNMSICGQVKIQTESGLVYDTDKRDIVYAIYRNECIGMANLTFNNISNTSNVYLTVLGNDEMSRKELSFLLWQAATGKTFHLTPSRQIVFAHGSVYGCGDSEPVIFTTSGSETQEISLIQGWNWISTYLNLQPESAPLNTIMSAAEPWTEGDLIKNPASRQFSSYSEAIDQFVGTLTGWDYKQMYMFYSHQTNILQLSGNNLPEEAKQITLRGNGQWNVFPCLLNETTEINEAMADYYMNATAGDIIKAHNQFAVFTPDKHWFGNLAALRPGEGYLMRRMAPEEVTMRLIDKPNNAPRRIGHLFSNPQAATNMTMIAKIALSDNGLSTLSDNGLSTVNVYVGDELAAIASPIESLFFLTIQSDNNGELRFETADGTPLVSETLMHYEADSHYGSLKAPVTLKPIDPNCVRKIIENEHVIIIRNNEKYDVTGKKIQ